eukprot:440579-Amorphochlora_amoeboformis.AAC.1
MLWTFPLHLGPQDFRIRLLHYKDPPPIPYPPDLHPVAPVWLLSPHLSGPRPCMMTALSEISG